MDKMNNSKATPTKRTGAKNGINLDYDYNSEFGDGDIPNVDKPKSSASKNNVVTDASYDNDPDLE